MLYATMQFIFIKIEIRLFQTRNECKKKNSLKNICNSGLFFFFFLFFNFHLLKILTNKISQNCTSEKVCISQQLKCREKSWMKSRHMGHEKKLRQRKCAGGKPCEAIFWPTPDYKRKTFFQLLVLSAEGVLNFYTCFTVTQTCLVSGQGVM